MPEETPPRSPQTRALMAIPLSLSVLVLIGALYLAFRLQHGPPAAGDRVRMSLSTTCAAGARGVIAHRAEAIGLGTVQISEEEGGLSVVATLPGLPDDRSAIPALLTKPGHFEIHAAGRTVATESDVAGTALNMDAGGSPYAEITLNGLAFEELREAAAGGGVIEALLDGETLLSEDAGQLRDARIRIFPKPEDPAARMRAAVDLTVLLPSGALPCPVQVTRVVDAPAAAATPAGR